MSHEVILLLSRLRPNLIKKSWFSFQVDHSEKWWFRHLSAGFLTIHTILAFSYQAPCCGTSRYRRLTPSPLLKGGLKSMNLNRMGSTPKDHLTFMLACLCASHLALPPPPPFLKVLQTPEMLLSEFHFQQNNNTYTVLLPASAATPGRSPSHTYDVSTIKTWFVDSICRILSHLTQIHHLQFVLVQEKTHQGVTKVYLLLVKILGNLEFLLPKESQLSRKNARGEVCNDLYLQLWARLMAGKHAANRWRKLGTFCWFLGPQRSLETSSLCDAEYPLY